MFFILLFLVVMTAYLGVGTVYSRNRYASILAANGLTASDFSEIRRFKDLISTTNTHIHEATSTKIVTLTKHHKSNCDKIRWNHVGTCGCGATEKLRATLNAANKYLENKIDEPDVFKPLLLWPQYVTESFLKSGAASERPSYDPALTAELEKELLTISELLTIES